MSAKEQVKKEIIEAYVFLREYNTSIPSETLEFIKDASLNILNETDRISEIRETYLNRIRSANKIIDTSDNEEHKQRLRNKVIVYKYLVIELEQ